MSNESPRQELQKEVLPASPERIDDVLNATRLIFDELAAEERKGLVYAVMGGTALQAFSDTKYNPIRENGTPRDIDVMVLDDPNNTAPELQKIFNQRYNANQSTVPRASMKVVRNKEYASPLQLISMIKKTSDGYAFVFRDIAKNIPPEVLAPVVGRLQTSIGDLSFTTFHPKTLLHLYITVIGSMRPKDIEKLRAFAKETSKVTHITDADDIDHEKYRVFHEYAREMRERYPVYMGAVKLFDHLDSAFFKTFGIHTLPTKFSEGLLIYSPFKELRDGASCLSSMCDMWEMAGSVHNN